MRLFLPIVLMMTLLLVSPDALAIKSPRPQGVDGRIQTIMYGPDEVFKYTGHYGYQSSIVFEEGEEIGTISMGDSTPWQIEPSGNRIFLKPVLQDAQTNMTVLTNRRSYLFELHAREAESIDDPQLIWVLKFVYPTEETVIHRKTKKEKLRTPENTPPQNFNYNYTLRGSFNFAPIKVYDDGEFTYFQFRDKNASLPAFFMVDPFGNESLVNFRTRDDLIIVERVASRYTLRHGAEIVCVYNESMPIQSQAGGVVPGQ